jgi:hypothetical protein
MKNNVTWLFAFLYFFLIAHSVNADSLFLQPYEREGSSYRIDKSRISAVSAVSFGDLLEPLPWGDVQNLSYGGTLSDYKFTGHELFMDDRPFVLEVNCMLLRGASADRIYFNRLPMNNVDSIRISSGGGLAGSEQRISVYTKDDFRQEPKTRVLWETGPFGWSAVQFAFSRRLSANSGLSLSVQKTFQGEDDNYYRSGVRYYDHPEAIKDIYRVLLGRETDEYVADGIILESDFSRWNLSLNFLPAGLLNVCVGFEYLNDVQMDARPFAANTLQNLSSKRAINRLSLRMRPVNVSLVRWYINVYNESTSLKFPVDPMIGFSNTSYSSQGCDAYGFVSNASVSFGSIDASLEIQAAEERLFATQMEQYLTRTLFNPSLSSVYGFGKLHGNWSLSGAVRLDERSPGGFGRILFSPALNTTFGFAELPITFNATLAEERRLPNPEVFSLPNKRMNLVVTNERLGVITSRYLQSGLIFGKGTLQADYSFEYRKTEDPAVLKANAIFAPFHWSYSQQVLDYEARVAHFIGLAFVGKKIYQRLAGELVNYRWQRIAEPDTSFNTFSISSESRVSGRFVENRLGMQAGFTLRLKPSVWSIDPWISTQPYTLGWHLTTELNMNFTVKTFMFFTKFENLSNYIIRYEPGYYLPGPTVRWGIDWSFGG